MSPTNHEKQEGLEHTDRRDKSKTLASGTLWQFLKLATSAAKAIAQW